MSLSVSKFWPTAYPARLYTSRCRRWPALLGALVLGALWSLGVAWRADAQVPLRDPEGLLAHARAITTLASPVPESVRLFEQQKHVLPKSNFNLSLCQLLARGPRNKVFPGLPADRGPETCDLTHVYLAFDGFCEAGVRDHKGGVHFSQSLMPMIKIVEYANGTVIYVNNYLKFDTETTAEDEQAAIDYFSRTHAPDATHDVRGAQLSIFPTEWDGEIPLKKRVP